MSKNQFLPLPLRVTVPTLLLFLGSIGGAFSLHQQVTASNQRVEAESLQRAKFTSEQTSGILDYMFRTGATERVSFEGANLVISRMGGDPNLELAALLDHTDRIRSATRYDLQNRAIATTHLVHDPSILAMVRQQLAGRLAIAADHQSLQSLYPIRLPAQPGELRPSRIGLLLLKYNLAIPKQQAFSDAFQRSIGTTVVLAALCLLVWLLFEAILTRRAARLVTVSDQLANGNLSARANLQGSDELAQIATAFDRMAERLQQDTEALQHSEAQQRQQTLQLEQTLQDLQHTQAQLVQTEKMSSLGQMVAGVAHEINNPVNFIAGNITHVSQYAQDLLHLLELYQVHYPTPVAAIQTTIDEIDLPFIHSDFPRMLTSMRIGSDRIREIVLTLRNFSRLDEAGMKEANLHEGIDSSLLILQHRLKATSTHEDIQILKDYGALPPVECYPGQLNQVFMNILSNAIDALEDYHSSAGSTPAPPTIWIQTCAIAPGTIGIRIRDNGPGMPAHVQQRVFDPFFTTKPVGKGTGLGLSISYQIIVEKHKGTFQCQSQTGQGTEFWIELPVSQPADPMVNPSNQPDR